MTDRLLCVLLLLLVAAAPAIAQDPYDVERPVRRLPLGDALLSLPTSQIAPQAWEVRFSHRFHQPLSQGSFADQFHSLFGLDSNADVAIGLSYATRPNLQVSLLRSNTNDTFEGAVKYVMLQQTTGAPVGLALRGGADWRTEKDLGDRTSVFAQAIVSRQFGRKAEVFAIPTFATNAGRAASADASVALFEHAFNIPVGVAVMLRPGLSLVAEITPPNADLPDELGSDFAWAIGIKRALGGHWFEILLTNSQGTTVDQYVTTSFQGGPLEAGNVHLGFNIERRFGRIAR